MVDGGPIGAIHPPSPCRRAPRLFVGVPPSGGQAQAILHSPFSIPPSRPQRHEMEELQMEKGRSYSPRQRRQRAGDGLGAVSQLVERERGIIKRVAFCS